MATSAAEARPHAIVTGGSSGIGAATARIMHGRGYTVTIVGRREDRLREIAAAHPGMTIHVADLSTPEANRDMVEQIVSSTGSLAVLVNASGVLGESLPLADVSDAEWDFVLGTNLRGPIAATTAAVPYLSDSRGSVVNISSVNAIQSEFAIVPYSVSKAALAAFTKFAAIDLAPRGIRINAVLPGWVRTPMIDSFLEDARITDGGVTTNALGRIAEPEEIGDVIAYLASPGASFITGECVVVDGGQWIYSRDLTPVPS